MGVDAKLTLYVLLLVRFCIIQCGAMAILPGYLVPSSSSTVSLTRTTIVPTTIVLLLAALVALKRILKEFIPHNNTFSWSTSCNVVEFSHLKSGTILPK